MRSHDKARLMRAAINERLGDGDVAYVRHRRGGGPWGAQWGGPGGPPFGFGGPRAFGGGRGRKRRGDVRLALLILLGEGPANGYQLMQEIGERSEGRWNPSPGSVYPALSQLEDEGLIRTTESDTGRGFGITDAGREHLAERGEQKAPWEPEDEDAENQIADFRHAIASTAKAAAQVVHDGDEAKVARAVEILGETRRALYRLLAEEDTAGDDTQTA